MVITKATVGFVLQRYDTETKQWLDQEFVAGCDVDWENEFGEAVDIEELEDDEPYLPFDMVQPKQSEEEE